MAKNPFDRLSGRLGDFKESIASQAKALEEFRRDLLKHFPGRPGTSKQRKTPLYMRTAKRRRVNKAARRARRNNRRKK